MFYHLHHSHRIFLLDADMEHHHTAQHHIFIGNEHCAVHCKSAFTVCAFCLPLAGLSLYSANVVDETDLSLDDSERDTESAYDAKDLRITGIGVKVSDDRERWIIFHHFLWNQAPKFYGTEAIQLWPVYRDLSDGWDSGGDVTGRVLYNRNEETFVADYYSLGTQTYASNSFFFGPQDNTDVFATFSMPRQGSSYRGYIAYPIKEVQDGCSISSWINYVHQKSWVQYPVITAMENRMTNSWNYAGAFQVLEDALQFYPSDEGINLYS